jgi:hypothetical protein
MISRHLDTVTIDSRFTITNKGKLPVIAVDASDLGLRAGTRPPSTISLKSPKTGNVVLFTAVGADKEGTVFYDGMHAGRWMSLCVYND